MRGEIGRLSLPRSGHVYLDLKDDRSVLASVIWKGVAGRLAHAPEEGMEVVATGRLTTFPGQSKYQLVIEDLVPAGAGALMAMLERRRTALAAEGLFDEARKASLPFLPDVIGVVTSPSGAVIRDILHRLRDRFPRHVLIWPVAVQGAACAPEVARAIRGFNALPEGGPIPRPDVLIVARGGGSLEDLWGFNEEAVVRAAAESAIPLISAVGHETDTTLIDHASDRRAPTPTAAAENGGAGALGPSEPASAAGRLHDARRTAGGRDAAATAGRSVARPAAAGGPARHAASKARPCRPATRPPRCGRRRRCGGASSINCPGGLEPALERAVARRRLDLGRIAGQLRPSVLRNRSIKERDRLAEVVRRGDRAVTDGLARRRERLSSLERLHTTLGYEATLQRGYAVVYGRRACGDARWRRRKARRVSRSSSPMASWPWRPRTGPRLRPRAARARRTRRPTRAPCSEIPLR